MAAAVPITYLGDSVDGAPNDGVSRIRFSSTSDVLLASSWDRVSDVHGHGAQSAKMGCDVCAVF